MRATARKASRATKAPEAKSKIKFVAKPVTEAEFTRCYLACEPSMRGMALKYGGRDEMLADDLVQDAVLKLLELFREGEFIASPEWVKRVARNRILDVLRVGQHEDERYQEHAAEVLADPDFGVVEPEMSAF